ncbi:hypothetical protein AU476_12340 [Cupriavidus sp. UYMSc13B]|nr:hypothetical protein AU476_12340 [Cupriavidus sp. UYMSc13B]
MLRHHRQRCGAGQPLAGPGLADQLDGKPAAGVATRRPAVATGVPMVLSGQTLRQVVRLSVGGKRVRVVLVLQLPLHLPDAEAVRQRA